MNLGKIFFSNFSLYHPLQSRRWNVPWYSIPRLRLSLIEFCAKWFFRKKTFLYRKKRSQKINWQFKNWHEIRIHRPRLISSNSEKPDWLGRTNFVDIYWGRNRFIRKRELFYLISSGFIILQNKSFLSQFSIIYLQYKLTRMGLNKISAAILSNIIPSKHRWCKSTHLLDRKNYASPIINCWISQF